jgi:hypothetical protein
VVQLLLYSRLAPFIGTAIWFSTRSAPLPPPPPPPSRRSPSPPHPPSIPPCFFFLFLFLLIFFATDFVVLTLLDLPGSPSHPTSPRGSIFISKPKSVTQQTEVRRRLHHIRSGERHITQHGASPAPPAPFLNNDLNFCDFEKVMLLPRPHTGATLEPPLTRSPPPPPRPPPPSTILPPCPPPPPPPPSTAASTRRPWGSLRCVVEFMFLGFLGWVVGGVGWWTGVMEIFYGRRGVCISRKPPSRPPPPPVVLPQ